MTTAPAQSTPALQATAPTIAEDVQLMLVQQPGRLEFDTVVPVAGVLIELTLLGRITSEAKKGFFADTMGLITVADATPTGNPILDSALRAIVERGRPWQTHRAILGTRIDVTVQLHTALEARGLTRTVGKPERRGSHLEIVDPEAVEARRAVLKRARTLPDTVVDPRLGGVVDLLRSSGNLYRGETGPINSRITRDWYPPHATETMGRILAAEGYLAESQ